ncbi:MAG: NAD(P)/FAD-dependent oxidoreductase, partial [Steroidobacteraceae bacterium]
MNLALAPAPSWYEASVKRTPPSPPLAGSITADVCVVGAGIAGCSTAMHLAERGYKVVLLEAEQAGFGASGRSGGQLLPGYASSQQKLTALIGRDDARRLWDFTLEGVDLVRERVRRHAIDCDLAWGHMHCAVKSSQIDELRDSHREFEEAYGYRSTRFMVRAEVEGLLSTSRYCAGLYDTAAGHCHPLKYALGIAAATKVTGVH